MNCESITTAQAAEVEDGMLFQVMCHTCGEHVRVRLRPDGLPVIPEGGHKLALSPAPEDDEG